MCRARARNETASAFHQRPSQPREWVIASVPAVLRQQPDKWAEAWLTTTFSQLLEMRARDPGPFNYPLDVFSEWRGKAFYLCARYRTRSVVPRMTSSPATRG